MAIAIFLPYRKLCHNVVSGQFFCNSSAQDFALAAKSVQAH